MINPYNVQKIKKALINHEVRGDFYPSVYIIELSSVCNLRCIMCPNNQMHPKKKGLIEPSLFKQIICDIAPFCEFLMLYWLGEPLMHHKLEELLFFARSKISGKIVLSSNMTILDYRLSRSILSNTDILICCVDRWDKHDYEKVRLGAEFETVIKNINSLLNYKKSNDPCEIVVKALDINNNIEEYNKFKDYWSSKGCRPLLAWLCDWAGTFKEIRQSAKLPIPRKEKARVPCADLWFKLVMNWQGNVQMCCFDWKYAHSMGAFQKKSDWIKLTWQSKQFVNLREAHLKDDWSYNSLCERCTTWGELMEFNSYVDFNENSYFVVF